MSAPGTKELSGRYFWDNASRKYYKVVPFDAKGYLIKFYECDVFFNVCTKRPNCLTFDWFKRCLNTGIIKIIDKHKIIDL